VKLLLDENLSSTQAQWLREDGFDAVAITELGLSGAPDERVREVSIEQGRVLVTMDADFANILRFPPAGTPGVLRLRIHPPTEAAIREQLRVALEILKNTDINACLAVSHGRALRIRR
jgi:predicted nuclease of predicted toxin-antitoxin system